MNERKMNLRKIAMVGGMIAMTAMLSAIMMTGCGCQQRTEKNRQRGLDGKETDQSCGMVLIYLIIQKIVKEAWTEKKLIRAAGWY